MANFKGGFAFNNEAAKVEVEQEADGTLVSCINPVTGEELGGGGMNVETYGHNFVVKNTRGSNLNVTYTRMNVIDDVPEISLWPRTLSNNQSDTVTKAVLFNGIIIVSIPTGSFAITCTNCTAEVRTSSAPSYKYLYVTVIDTNEDCQIVIAAG